jgi:hypothetical protein
VFKDFPLFDQAVTALKQAVASADAAERDVLLEKALRLNRLATGAARRDLSEDRPASSDDRSRRRACAIGERRGDRLPRLD